MKIEKMIEQHKQMWAAFEKLNEKLEEKQNLYIPKNGEYVFQEAFNIDEGRDRLMNITIYKEHRQSYASYFFEPDWIAYDLKEYILDHLRPATPEERQLLDDKLKEQGKRWNAEKKQIEDIPTWKVGDWFIPHKPKENKAPIWIPEMDEYDGKACEIKSIDKDGDLRTSSMWAFHPDWCEKTEAPKKEPKIGDMCIFWDNDKEYAVCALYDGARHDYFMDTTGAMWQNCIPFESIEQYKKFINEEC